MFAHLHNSLAKLRQADRKHRVFGSSRHKYISTPLSPDSLESFERSLQVALPVAYREFLLQIGFGSGPYYGIWSPAEVLKELESLAFDSNEFAERSPRPRPSDPFPLEVVGVEIVEQDWPSGGCIPICHQGCTYWSVLVLEGVFRGKVWDLACFQGTDGEWLPARRPSGIVELDFSLKELIELNKPPSFEEWLEGWVERCIANLSVR